MQVKCFQATDGAEWMGLFDDFHPAVRRALCDCEINICAACFGSYATRACIDLYSTRDLSQVHKLIYDFTIGAIDNDYAERNRRESENQLLARFPNLFISPNNSAAAINDTIQRASRDFGSSLERSVYDRAFFGAGTNIGYDAGEDVRNAIEEMIRSLKDI